MSKPAVHNELQKIRDQWEEIAKFCFDESVETDAELAQAEYELKLHIGAVKIQDLFWLRETFEGIDLVELSFAIATELYPDKEWEILENDEIAIVTDRDRTIVMDLKYGSELSAGASLFLAGEESLNVSTADAEEALAFQKARIDLEITRVAKLNTLLRQGDNEAKVLAIVEFSAQGKSSAL